jgi:hypothetical protein
MEAIYSSETWVDFQRTTWRYISQKTVPFRPTITRRNTVASFKKTKKSLLFPHSTKFLSGKLLKG